MCFLTFWVISSSVFQCKEIQLDQKLTINSDVTAWEIKSGQRY